MLNLPVIELVNESRRRFQPAARSTHAFSLLEVLVATTILAVIVSMLGSIMSSVSASWTSAAGRTETGLSARAIADYIQTDLAPALLPVNNSDQANLQFILNPSPLPEDYKNGDALFWQSPVANDTTYGDIAEVGYFVKWITDSNNQPKPILCRFFVEPTESGTASVYKIYQSPSNWLNKDSIDEVAPGTSDKNYAGLFAENVIGIWFRCFDSQGNCYGRAFDSRTAPSDATKSRLPCSVQVSFVVVDSRSAERLTASLQSALMSLNSTVSGEVATKDKTVSPATADASLKSISAGLKAHTTTVSLVNSR
jgi:prepilin-type N-terminal cleavage/methylation domain-containing protein